MIDHFTSEEVMDETKKNNAARLNKKAAKKTQEYIQLLFRCDPDLHVRIIKALGITMSKSGNKVSKNTFVIQLIEMGLKSFERGH